jgi:hypothetical protein
LEEEKDMAIVHLKNRCAIFQVADQCEKARQAGSFPQARRRCTMFRATN